MYFVVLAHLLCPLGASLHFAVCHTPCYSYSLRSGSYLCPSPHFIHYVLRSATITPRSQLSRCIISWLPTCKHTIANPRREAHSISQNQRYNTHWVSLSLHYVLHSFQSGYVHPLPIILRALRACPGYVFVMVFDPQHKGLTKIKNTRQTLA
jgi:hypothetical protein